MLKYTLRSAHGNIGIYLIFLLFIFFGVAFAGIGIVVAILSSDGQGDTRLLTLIFVGTGLLFALIGLIPLLLMRRTQRRGKKLLANGRRISAKLIEACQNTSVTVNGHHPFQIICHWIDPNGQLWEFKSEYLWHNPYYIIDKMNVQSMDVYLDENSPKRYYMDVRRFKPKR